mgnify:CR=1 FL=1
MNTAVTAGATACFHHSQFADAATLVEKKTVQGLRISLCIPTLNEEPTIGRIVTLLRAKLQEALPLLDEIAVIDSGSCDRTLEIARAAGAEVYRAADILPEQGDCPGKGENLWKALYQLAGDIIVYLDGDTTNMHPRFVTGLLGPLLTFPHIDYVKAYYARPALAEPASLAGGGRVTEILIRPLLALFFPEVSTLIQPLSGEYAARRSLLERLPFPVGYGVEVAHLTDICHGAGLEVMAQVDLDERHHRHRSNQELGKMAFALAKVLCRRLQGKKIIAPELILPDFLHQIDFRANGYQRVVTRIAEEERPPMIEIEAYRARHPGQYHQEQSGQLPAAQRLAG